MRYADIVRALARRGTDSLEGLSPRRRAHLAAALMEEVGAAWGPAFLTDAPEAGRYPELLRRALAGEISAEEFGRVLLEGAVRYAAPRLERDLRRGLHGRA
ncbi:MAG: hypothetical protein D6739_10410 [Nitrospirae bacterium]|nr:MAG: hypothetical protein D6739_10410 [Nitrospirota bacterium]